MNESANNASNASFHLPPIAAGANASEVRGVKKSNGLPEPRQDRNTSMQIAPGKMKSRPTDLFSDEGNLSGVQGLRKQKQTSVNNLGIASRDSSPINIPD